MKHYRWPIPGGSVSLLFDGEFGLDQIRSIRGYLDVVEEVARTTGGAICNGLNPTPEDGSPSQCEEGQ